MKERRLILNGAMARAAHDGTKTQLRVLMEHGPHADCPLGKPGDRLWVAETHQIGWPADDYGDPDQYDEDGNELPKHVWYRASVDGDGWTSDQGCFVNGWMQDDGFFGDMKWRPSAQMPRWASRTTLEIVRVWVERLQQISEEDAELEGASLYNYPGYEGEVKEAWAFAGFGGDSAREVIEKLWDSTHASPFQFDDNPRVWCCEFERVEQ